eukprot:CAMPEP_0172512418 /NCGR_PEP_ID=MMETSP1066-20121228/244544_1 /TAXON_ID=671091 /ORGANISM="Coscinodiscus wailesii, Strain CCMP2513" /LENGTH=36 /DNA_ID= /DNA_START= /DNA_END= /DNA_ORIENTATION=
MTNNNVTAHARTDNGNATMDDDEIALTNDPTDITNN